ncbi:MAG: lysophospholipase [Gammaproteobacteria bacterium]|nr:hypothetical protein [Chlamydiia bacterium]MCH9690351.1 lysophospholipase [Gammaproteobacteria bacterium]
MRKTIKRLLMSFALFSNLQANPVEGKQAKVVLIHGIIKHNSMSTFNRLLKKNGWDAEQWYYPSRKKTIEQHAEDLVIRLKNIDKEGQPINFVAFSLGGLILKAALNHPHCPENAFKGKIVIISSPLKGSSLARKLGGWLLTKKVLGQFSGKQLIETPENGFDYLGEFPKDCPLLVLSGTQGYPILNDQNDGRVTIHESCPDRPHDHKFISSGHMFICRNIKTINETINFFKETEHTLHCPLKRNTNS